MADNIKQGTATLCGSSLQAGAEGFEPSTKVLETHVLPLHHAPTRLPTVNILSDEGRNVKHKFSGFCRVLAFLRMMARDCPLSQGLPRFCEERPWERPAAIMAMAIPQQYRIVVGLPMRRRQLEISFTRRSLMDREMGISGFWWAGFSARPTMNLTDVHFSASTSASR